jgi:hypothetical protein
MLTGRGHCRSLDQSAESMEEPRFGRVSRVVRDCFICFPLGQGRVRAASTQALSGRRLEAITPPIWETMG